MKYYIKFFIILTILYCLFVIFLQVLTYFSKKYIEYFKSDDDSKKKIIIGSYHKTGSTLFRNIWKYYDSINSNKAVNTSVNFHHNNHFNRVNNDLIKSNKCIVIIRNPYEIIMSGVRYHQITDEKWCNIKKDKFGGLSYKQYINKLDYDD